MGIVSISDDGRKAEICNKFMAYDALILIIVLTEPNYGELYYERQKERGKLVPVLN
jgi:hypothetical protein